jgi:hypothetical protein
MRARLTTLAVVASLTAAAPVRAQNPIYDWIGVMNTAVLTPPATNPLYTSRNVGLVGAAIYDAVNGIEKAYTPLVVPKYTGPHASARAAAVQAAYAMLSRLYPTQTATFDARRTASLAAIGSGPGADHAKEIENGIAYGQLVADTIFEIRSHDGFAPDPAPRFLGVDAVGFWRPTAAGTSGAGPQCATMTPWVLIRGNQFRLPPPPALGSAAYRADFLETKTMGDASASAPRTADQTALARFWNGNTALYWNRIASQISQQRSLSLVDSARVFGLLNVAMADAAIACWDGKYRYVFWRPVTAINQSDENGAPITPPSPAWAPLLGVTPAHPEYPSGHSTVSGAAQTVLAELFGDATSFTIDSEVAGSTPRSFPSFSAALAEIHDARVFGGIHFRTACRLGSALGRDVANWVMAHAMTAQP